jgi:predicted glycosyltransferase
MRVWVDFTNSPHVLVLRPLIAALRADGHEVAITARDFAQTVALCARFGLDCEVIGRHRGAARRAKALGLADRSLALIRWARRRRFDVAIGHGSNDLSVAAFALRIPATTMFDYEWATVQHTVNCRLCATVVIPEYIPAQRLDRYGARGKVQQYAGLKEEYYLADFEPDPAVLQELGLDPAAPIAVIRTPPSVSLYHRFENDVFAQVLLRVRDQAQTVVLPRVAAQRGELERAGGFVVPERAIDAQSLIAYADLVISAGGTMNREAVALGTPAFTTFEGRPGAVDAALIAEGRLGRLEAADAVTVVKRAPGASAQRIRRDPRSLLALALTPLRG